jgi:hypothetical protein
MANPAGNRSRRTLRRGNINAAIARRRDRHSAVTGGTEPLEEINLVGSWRKENAKDSADSIFANNPFFDELLEWRGSPEGQQYAEFADVLCDLMADVHLDAAQRRFIWPDGELLDLDQSVAHIEKQYPDFRRDWIEEYLIAWIEMDYALEHYSREQLDELDRLTAQWIADHLRRAKNSKKRRKTRHS